MTGLDASQHEAKKACTVLAISSQVIRGSVGLRAAGFAFETLGHSLWALPTIILPWHPGHGKSTRSVEEEHIFSAQIDELIASPFLDEVDGVLTGYMGAAYQVSHVARLIKALKQKNKNLQYLCDPVIGDGNALYVDEVIAQDILNKLMPLADVLTPNRFELAWLSGQSSMDNFEDNQQIIKAARQLPPHKILVTSAFAMMRGNIGNLLVDETSALLAEHRYIDGVPNGLGDLTSALFLARILEGSSYTKALEKSTAAGFEISHRSVKLGANELALQHNRDSLQYPMAQVLMRNFV